MKHGVEYAKKVKKLFQQLTRKFGKPTPGEPGDPIEQLIIGILAECTTFHKAHSTFRKVREQMVDLNDLRVTPPFELARLIGDGIPLATVKARRIIDTLNAVRVRQDTMDLSFLRQRSRREAREYLESLEGVGPFASAYVVLHSLGGHAIPVDALTVYTLRKEGVVDPAANIGEVQGFLERHISASDALVFSELLNRHVNSKVGRVSIEELSALAQPPVPVPPPAPEPEPPVTEPAQPEPVAKPAKTPKSATKQRASSKPEAAEPATTPKKKVAAQASTPAAKKTAKPEKPKPRKKK
ncbi:MAG: hypothetical protein GXY44_13205 [Phycisphaerales bacterium]|nr:hypothetical protein [Phycisphaerales bacterium]